MDCAVKRLGTEAKVVTEFELVWALGGLEKRER
jgi:hypothetical protein